MSITWADFRTQIRRSVLEDDVPGDNGEYTWSDDQLLDFLGWALDEFCAHTAVATATSYEMDGEASSLTLPDNVYGSVMDTGLVRLTQDELRRYMQPVWRKPGTVWSGEAVEETTEPKAYWEQPRLQLNFGFVPDQGALVEVSYFAHYDVPLQDTDLLDVPRWALQGIGYLIGAAAAAVKGVQTSRVRQWASKPDAGTPEHNPLHRQTEVFRALYQSIINRHPPQQRALEVFRE